ncbi:MAG: hypothetical protein A2998_02070 [Candidatus Staskawiczbacteria bacterium RIFCSPLOWO2_01_FULL_37_25b]|uniref:DUF3160 domain-containing protein n=2 Tax=Candidatus Staskawicziibacteriota TaxID=1817916 RepID=A0A1G2HS55_9BACT|nr:MAG: hypothetical protein A2812_00225 [Candidatus Staskawiczbacteria bacterium RIFCSPHIGHO2_01_FULL_36_16]OGZ74261.1 MAG: hypothetical protein A2998_02070 [Candidatus Staskawiczbacteria bacterium RIFCSPLOWO2_01_FULL_37_25b]
MTEPRVVEYIKKARAAGQKDLDIKSALLQNGWSEQEINENLLAVGLEGKSFVSDKNDAEKPVLTKAEPESAKPATVNASSFNVGKKPLNLPWTWIALMSVIAVVIIGGAVFVFLKYPSFFVAPSSTKSEQNTANTAESAPVIPAFASYNLESTKYSPSLPDYKIALSELANLSSFEQSQKVSFSDAQKQSLADNNFFVAANYDKFYNTSALADAGALRNDDWTGLYKSIGGSYNIWEREPENSVFITTDFLTHVYHKLIDEEFSYIEEINFYPTLSSLSKSMLELSAKAYSTTEDAKQKESYERLSAYFLVPSAILENATEDYNSFKEQNFVNDSQSDKKQAVLAAAESLAKDNNVSDNTKNIAKREITLIFDAKSLVSSPLMGKYQPGMLEDYTQFTPRSHYAKNVILRDYFRAMMFYGRMNFLLSSSELTRDALNISQLLSTTDLKKWESIYLPTLFFVGQSDDLSIYEFNDAVKKTGFASSDKGDEAVTKIQDELKTYKNPQIMSSAVISPEVFGATKEDLQNSTKGFRFMGQRFTPDAFIFSTLTQGDETPDPKTGQKLPSTPTALMVSTLMGSKTSADLLNVWIQNNAPNSDKVIADRMQTLQDYFDGTTQSQWTQNIYWSWLYAIKSLFKDTNAKGYPVFMKSEDWNKKSLQSFLGSWTELKHDTLLYAKQSYAEAGGGGPEENPAKPVPKGYVEPNIEFFDRIIALVNLTNDGLNKFGILPEYLASRNNAFKEAVQFYRKIAVSELQNEKISDEDFEKLRLSAGNLDNILQAPDSEIKLESNARSALIADVHTDVKQGQILYEADGVPNYIFVAVKDTNGARLTKGLVYSYYEFTDSLAKRLTDADWQKFNYSDSIKKLKMQDWNKSLIK